MSHRAQLGVDVQLRPSPAQHALRQAQLSQLMDRKRVQVKVAGSSGQGFLDGLFEQRLVGSGDPDIQRRSLGPASRQALLLVDAPLELRKKVGCERCLVQNQRIRKLVQEKSRVILGSLPKRQIIQAHETVTPQMIEERRLAYLAWTFQNFDG